MRSPLEPMIQRQQRHQQRPSSSSSPSSSQYYHAQPGQRINLATPVYEPYESKKRARVATLKSTYADMDNNTDDEEFNSKQRRAESKHPNKSSNELNSTHAKLENFIAYSLLLEKKIELMNDQLFVLQQQLHESKTKENEATRLVQFFQTVTSMEVSNNNSNNNNNASVKKENDFVCTLKNTRLKKATRFIFTCPDLNNNNTNKSKQQQVVRYEFLPLTNAEMLPEFLRAHIEFDPNMAPVLMGDILQDLYKEEEEEEEEDNNK